MFGSSRRLLPAAALAALLLIPRVTVRSQSSPQEPLPDPAVLLERMVEAMGGEATIRRHAHRTLTGTFELTGQISGATIVIRQSAPNLRVVSIELPGQGKILSGSDGETAWRIGPDTEPRVLEDKQRDRALRDADCFPVLHYQRDHRDIETVGMREFAERPCYELRMIDAGGDALSLFIDIETFRIAGEIGSYPGTRGDMAMRTIFEAYERFDGEWIATKTRRNIGAFQEQIVTIEDVSFEPLDRSVFDVPEPILPLLEGDDRQREG